MIQKNITGYCCYWNEELTKMRRVAGYILIVLIVLIVVLALWSREPIFLLVEVYPLIFLGAFACSQRFGYDTQARFALSGAGIQTFSKSPRMRRRFSWEEVSVIQITTMEGTRAISPWDCFVIVKGEENALIKCQALETYAYVFKNPNRIAIPKNEQTEPFITAIAERYGIPVEHSLLT